MKKLFALLLALAMVLSMVACGAKTEAPETGKTETGKTESGKTESGNAGAATEGENALAGTYDITMWVSEMDGVAALTQSQIEAFMAANPGIIINASIEGVTEADAGSKVVADVASAPDIYCFAQDQLARLVQAAALAAPGKAATETIIANNDAGSVAASSVAGTLYCYPMTSDNGYYMYYDTSIISEEDAESLEAIIAACEANGVTVKVRTTVFRDENGDLITADYYEGKTIDVQGMIEYFMGDHQIKVFTPNDIKNKKETL